MFEDRARSDAVGSRTLLAVDDLAIGEPAPDVALLRMGRAMVDLYCESFAKVPKRITLDIDDTFDPYTTGQQLRLFNGHYDEYGFQQIVVFDGEGRFVTAVLRPRRTGRAAAGSTLSPSATARDPPLVSRQHRDPAARRQPLLQPRGSRLASRQRPQHHPRRRADPDLAPPCHRTQKPAHEGAVRRPRRARARSAASRSSIDGAQSWSRVERIVARVTKSARKDPTPASSSPPCKSATPRALYEDLCLTTQPGRKPHQVLEDASGGGSHVLHEGDGQSVPSRPPRRRLLADVGASHIDAEALDVARRPGRHLAPAPHQDRRPRRRNEAMIRVHLPTSCPAQDILRLALQRIPRLVT